MFFKTANFKVKEVYDGNNPKDVIKFNKRYASVLDKSEGVKSVDSVKSITATIEPNHLYLITSGLHGDCENENGDYFKWEELLKLKTAGKHDGRHVWETWISCPVLENHDSSAVRGEIIDVWPVKAEKSIDMLLKIEEKTNTNMVKGIRNGSITGTSMGVMVGHSYCSICDNLAHDESEWCDHLSPSKLNIKGRIYKGQDGNKYPQKLGQMVYEDNRDLEGVEDSIITLGEPADPKALMKQVLASTEKGNVQMPSNNDKQAIEAKRNSISRSNPGIVEFNRTSSGDGGRVARMGDSTSVDTVALQKAVAALWAKKGLGVKGENVESPLTSSKEVLEAISSGKLKKLEAIAYVEKFRLATAEQLDQMTPAKAIEVLTNDLDNEALHDQLIKQATEGDLALSEGDAKPEAAPKPDGKVDPHGQIPSTEVSDHAISESDAKPCETPGKPDGSINPEKMMPHDAPGGQAADTNKSKPADGGPTPTKVGTISPALPNTTPTHGTPDQAVSESEAKPAEMPTPAGSADPKGQMPSKNKGDQATSSGEAKPGEQPDPTKARKAQLDGLDMGGPMGGLDLGKDMDKDLGKGSKPSIKDQLEEAIEKIEEVLEIKNMLEEIELSLPDKEKKEKVKHKKGDDKPEKSEKKEEPKEDKKPDSKPEKKDEMPPSPAPKMDDAGLPPSLGYKAEYVEDTKSPEDSYYVVSLKKTPVFLVTAKNAFGKNTKSNLDGFKSGEYKDLLTATLNKQGAKEVFEKSFGKVGTILAQMDKLPEDKFEEPAKPMGVTPDVAQDISNDDSSKVDFDSVLIGAFSTILATSPSTTVEDVKAYLSKMGSEPDALNDFGGKLSKEVDHAKNDQEVKTDSPQEPTGGAPTPQNKLDMPVDQLKAAHLKMKEAIVKILPALKQAVKERDEYKSKLDEINKKDALKARVSQTLAFANKKAESGLITTEEVNKEAVRLAKLSDGDYNSELNAFENSLKIASKIAKKPDYTNVEQTNKVRVASLGPILASVPSQIESEVRTETFQWSVGFKK